MAICYLSCNHIFSSLLSYNLKEAILESTTVSMVFKQGGLLPKNTSKEQHQEAQGCNGQHTVSGMITN